MRREKTPDKLRAPEDPAIPTIAVGPRLRRALMHVLARRLGIDPLAGPFGPLPPTHTVPAAGKLFYGATRSQSYRMARGPQNDGGA
jgi:hypothetical protein